MLWGEEEDRECCGRRVGKKEGGRGEKRVGGVDENKTREQLSVLLISCRLI